MAVDTLVEADDLRSSIEAAWEAPETPTDTVDVPDDTISAEAVVDGKLVDTEPADKADHPTDPLRYANGKFKPTKADAAPEQAAPVETPSTDTAKASEQPASTPANAPPAGWTAAEKAEWSKLSPVAQAAVSRREAEISNGGKQWSEEKRRYEASIAPISNLARSRGMDVSQAAQLLASAQAMLDQNPVEGLRRIAATYGVNLATLAGHADGSQEQPDIAQLVRQQVAPLLAPLQERYAMEDSQRQQSAVDLVSQFAASPGHEHFEAVQSEIMDLIPGIKGRNPHWAHDKVLQEAYDRAVYANPETRASLLAAKEAETEARRVADAKARATNARKAAVSVTGSPSGAQSTAPKDSLRAEIEAAFGS